jgi:hypothetical protein
MDDDQKALIKAGAEAVFKPFSNLIERLFGGAADEVGLMLKNEVMFRRIGLPQPRFSWNLSQFRTESPRAGKATRHLQPRYSHVAERTSSRPQMATLLELSLSPPTFSLSCLAELPCRVGPQPESLWRSSDPG